MKHARLLLAMVLAAAAANCDKKTKATGAPTPGTPTPGAPAAPSPGKVGSATAGPLLQKVSTSTLYLGAKDGEYNTLLELSSGTINVGATIDGVDTAGHRLSFKVTKIAVDKPDPDSGGDKQVDAQRLSKGEKGAVDLSIVSGSMRDFGGTFFLVDAGAALPADVGAAADAETQAAADANGIVTCTLDGAPWPANVYSSGSAFYKNGIKMLKIAEPYFSITLLANKAPDGRQLMFAVRGWTPTTGKLDAKQVEVAFTGSATGVQADEKFYGFKAGKEYSAANVAVEVTRWELKRPDQARADITFSTKVLDLKAAISGKGGDTHEFANCKIANLAVAVHERNE